MTTFQIILMLAAGFFAYQVYMYIQNIDEDAEPSFMQEPEQIRQEPTSDELIEEADQAYRDDQIEHAKEVLSRVVERFPDIAEARNKLAFVLSKLGDNTGARAQYEASLSIDENDDMTHNALARLLVDMDELQEAEDHFQKALEIDDNYEVTWFYYAELLRERGQKEEAKKMYERALEISPEYEPAIDALKSLT